MDLDLSKIKKVCFIGIGGIGISALAKWAKAREMEVIGINDDESSVTLDPLREEGIKIIFKKDLKKLERCDLYIYSDAWLNRGPEIIEEAKGFNVPVINYAEALGVFAQDYKVIAISGTHGKTTTTAMVADILIDAGLDPTVIVGSFVKKFGSNFRSGHSEYLVVEADEYNRHMLHLHPYIGLVTNIEADHLDCYKDLKDIKEAFKKFLSQSKIQINDYGKYLEKVPKLSVPGVHNRQNAAAALAIADVLNIKEEISKKSLEEFSGTWRRLEKKGEIKRGIIIYDDYAHHPTEVKASLEALRELYPKKEYWNITVIFQPHLFSRTKALLDDFAKSFSEADQVMILPIYYAREVDDGSISSDKLAFEINRYTDNAEAFPDFESLEKNLMVRIQKFTNRNVIVTMGAGEAYKVGGFLLENFK